jgi:hypothetical protein
MIEITKAYKTEDGHTHDSLDEAKLHELSILVKADHRMPEDIRVAVREVLVTCINSAPQVIAILKLKPRKPRTSRAKKVKAVVALAK